MIIEWQLETCITVPMLHEDKSLSTKNRVVDMFYPIGETFYIEKIGGDLFSVTDVGGKEGQWGSKHLAMLFPDEEVFYATLAGFEM